MKGEKLFAAMTGIREEFIEEAAPSRKKHLHPAVKWGGLAAGILLIAGAALLQSRPQDLPLLPVEPIEASMGYEGYMAYDIDELTNANPWTIETELETLPVYRNLQQRSFDGSVTPFPAEEMEERLVSAAEGLGLEDYTVTDDAPDEETRRKITEKFAAVGEEVPEGYFDPHMLLIEAEGIRIEADNTLTVTIHLDPAAELPGGPLPGDASYDLCLKAAEELLEQYRAVIDMEEPVIDITGGDRDIHGVQRYDICFYEGAGDLGPLTGYHFDRIVFHRDDDGRLFIIRKSEADLSEKAGDYPVISVDEAEKLLCRGKYISTVPYEMPGKEYIAGVELVYRTDPGLEYFMPYYRFLVELPEMALNGMKDYGAYCVPAVEGDYLTGMSGFIF